MTKSRKLIPTWDMIVFPKLAHIHYDKSDATLARPDDSMTRHCDLHACEEELSLDLAEGLSLDLFRID